MSKIQIENVHKWFGDTHVIKDVNFTVEDGEFVIFVGPSGCGKSTLLRMIAGLEDTSKGRIIIGDRDVTGDPPALRELSMVFQSYALYPHMDVRHNMGFSLKTAGKSATEVAQKVDHAASILKLTDYLDRFPKELSGGQRQRVAIGRAIVRDPAAFLFDEPLSNLDASLRVDMRIEIAKLHEKLGTSMIYVTHDQVEAMTLADKIVVLRDGIVEQVGSPRQLYERPETLFVAQFIGSPKMNIVPCTNQQQDIIHLGPENETKPIKAIGNEFAHVGIRPEHISITESGMGHCNGTVDIIEYLGADNQIYVDCGFDALVTIRHIGDTHVKPGDNIGLLFKDERIILFNKNDEASY